MEYIKVDRFIEAKFGDIRTHIFLMKIEDLLPIYYVAVRGRDSVQGAVQRVLNPRRITAIKNFVLEGNMFFNSFILNWVDPNYQVEMNGDELKIPRVSAGAQVIDGQHRLEGIKQAYEEKPEIGDQFIIVVLAKYLSTADAARIFLNINTEQKPVPTSLVYDLFGEVREKNYYIVRATDIAKALNNDPLSPYYQCIKMPQLTAGVGKVDLSTFVNALKQFTADNGVFYEFNLDDFETEYKVVFNFFSAIRTFYERDGSWFRQSNPFLMNAGCYAGIEFLCKDLIPKCAERKSFEESTIIDLLSLDKRELLAKDDLRNVQGKEQRNIVYRYLKSALLKYVPNQDEYKF